MRSIVPGHFWAATIRIVIAIIAIAMFADWAHPIRMNAIGGLLLIVAGMFFIDQTTHLAQPAHESPAPTALERMMQTDPLRSKTIGYLVLAIGVLLALY